MSKEKKWLEYAHLHPVEWKSYLGSCNCYVCVKYRADFEQWLKKQDISQINSMKWKGNRVI
jgi:hypothetical protein